MDRWRTFVNYTHDQINELISDYGPLDILWLDGCWVRPLASINKQVAEFCKYPHDLDIDVKSIAASAHTKQPDLLIVDRWVPGEFENYLTPEQKTPDKALEVPWESCISMGGAWGYVPNDNYKSARELIQLLVRIVAKGGNLLLGIGSDGRGEFPPAVYERLAEMGRWLDSNGDAIYNTMPVEPFQEGSIAYTAKGDHTVFAIYLPEKGEKELPAEVTIKTSLKGALNISLPAFHEELKSENSSHGLKVFIPATLRKTLAGQPAVVIRLESASR
jgi:alpha-L-fucosidase